MVLNAQSPFYEMLQTKLGGDHEDLLFPLDAQVLFDNSLDFAARVHKANGNALAIANFLDVHDSISHVNYPTMVPTAALYEQYRRPKGGYGSLISLVFKDPDSAVIFYNAVDLCKGPSFGANFTLVLPYSQLAHAFELDWAESQGIAKHIIRISVGLEDVGFLIGRLVQALQEVKAYEGNQAVREKLQAMEVGEFDRVPKSVSQSTVTALQTLQGAVEWGQPGLARNDFRSTFLLVNFTSA